MFLVNEFLAVNGQFCSCGGAERAAELGGEPGGCRPGGKVEPVGDQRRRPARGGAEREHEPDASGELYRVCARGAARAAEPCAVHAAVCGAVEAPDSAIDAGRRFGTIRDFPEGSQRWDERVYHPDRKGEMRPLSELWSHGQRAGDSSRGILAAVRMMGAAPLSQRTAAGVERCRRDAGCTGAGGKHEALSCSASLSGVVSAG